MKTKQVEITIDRPPYAKGDVVALPEDQAKKAIEGGYAQLAKAETKVKASADADL